MTPEDDLSLDQLVRRQAAIIERLEQQLAKPVESDVRPILDINDVRVPYKFAKFPMTVYRKTSKVRVDHPGNDAKIVRNESDLQAHLKKNWQLEPHMPVVVDEDAIADAAVDDKADDTVEKKVPAKAAGKK